VDVGPTLSDEDVETVRLELLDLAETQMRDVALSSGRHDVTLVHADWTVRLVPEVESQR
jgi:hypothetical protein